MLSVHPPRIETAGPSGPAVCCFGSQRSAGARLALEALLEALHLARRVDDRLLAREERVAVAAYVDAQLLARRADGPLAAARAAMHLCFVVLGVNVRLHGDRSPPTPSVRGTCPAGGRRLVGLRGGNGLGRGCCLGRVARDDPDALL